MCFYFIILLIESSFVCSFGGLCEQCIRKTARDGVKHSDSEGNLGFQGSWYSALW